MFVFAVSVVLHWAIVQLYFCLFCVLPCRVVGTQRHQHQKNLHHSCSSPKGKLVHALVLSFRRHDKLLLVRLNVLLRIRTSDSET